MLNYPSNTRRLTLMANTTPSALLFLASLAVLLVTTYCALLKPLIHDEAFLLQAADSLSKGQGYASYGVMRGDGPWLFDPYLTTGPVVLAPLSVIWQVTNGDVTAIRIFMLCFLYLYLLGLFLLFRNKQLGPLSPALAIASSLCIVELPAGLVLGELPAATALIWSALAIKSNKHYTAAILAGLAIQIKLVYALAGGILLLALAIPLPFSIGRINLRYSRNVISMYAVFLIPTLMFELWRFLSFSDSNSWLANVDKFMFYLQHQNINTAGNWLDDQFLEQKISAFQQAFPISAWVAGGISIFSTLVWISRGFLSSKFCPGSLPLPRLTKLREGGGNSPCR